MDRTKNTARILRELQIPVSTSSSSADDNVVNADNPLSSAESVTASELGRDGIPNAQNTDDIGERGDDHVEKT